MCCGWLQNERYHLRYWEAGLLINILVYGRVSRCAALCTCCFMFCTQTRPSALSPSFLRLGSTPVSGDHGEGRVLAVLALDRGDKSLSTPEDSLPVGKLGTSLSRPCHTLPCRSSLIGPALWRAQPYFCHRQRRLRSVSRLSGRE